MTDKYPIKYENLKNKSVIITGGASGLGLATATRFAEHGAYVTIADVQDEAGKKQADELSDKGYKVTFVHCDTTSWTSSVAAFKHAVEFSPRKTLDAAALYAGVGGDQTNMITAITTSAPPSLDKDPTEPDLRIIDINLDGVVRSTYLALHYFRLPAVADAEAPKSKKKNLILCSSLAGYVDYPPTQYCIAKYGVRGLFRSIRSVAEKDASLPLNVNLIAPGYTPTPLAAADPNENSRRAQAIRYVTEQGLWARISDVVDFAATCATNDEMNGRSFVTFPRGLFDLDEDLDQAYGGPTLQRLMEESGYMKLGLQ